MAKKERYLVVGDENENFHGWGPEDVDRVKRMEVLNLPVYFSDGPFFHLWLPRGKTSWYANRSIERKNRRGFIKTCKRNGTKSE